MAKCVIVFDLDDDHLSEDGMDQETFTQEMCDALSPLLTTNEEQSITVLYETESDE